MDPKKLREQRANILNQAREILEKAEAEDRDLDAEEQEQWDRHMQAADELKTRIDRIEQQEGLIEDLSQRQGPAPLHTVQDLMDRRGDVETVEISPVLAEYFRIKQSEEERQRQLRQAVTFRHFLPYWISDDWRTMNGQELRALQADLDVSGGYLRPPEQFMNELIKAVDDMVYIRQWASTFTVTSAESLGVPTLDTDPADSNWTTELATGSEDSSMAFGKRNLHPHPLAKRIKISRKLIRAVPNAETLVRDRLAYKFGITFEKACLTGTGAGQPLGVFTASSDGISTSRDASTGNTTTEIRFDGLIEAKYTLKAAYWPRARWLFHRDGVKQIAKLKDGNGQYLWRESVRVGEPDRVLGVPVFMSEYAPNTFTTGLYVGMIGDFSNYWIADALTLEFQLLNELYAATNQVGLIGRLESDGMPVLEEAFVRVTLA
jgi:HK97 family phage major capsid protein